MFISRKGAQNCDTQRKWGKKLQYSEMFLFENNHPWLITYYEWRKYEILKKKSKENCKKKRKTNFNKNEYCFACCVYLWSFCDR